MMRLHPKEPVVQESASGIIRRLRMTHVLRPDAPVAPVVPVVPVVPAAPVLPMLAGAQR